MDKRLGWLLVFGLAGCLLMGGSSKAQAFTGSYTGTPFNLCQPDNDSFDWGDCYNYNFGVLNSSANLFGISSDQFVSVAVATAALSASTVTLAAVDVAESAARIAGDFSLGASTAVTNAVLAQAGVDTATIRTDLTSETAARVALASAVALSTANIYAGGATTYVTITGDDMTGPLRVQGSSVVIVGSVSDKYSFSVSTDSIEHDLIVSTMGTVAIGLTNLNNRDLAKLYVVGTSTRPGPYHDTAIFANNYRMGVERQTYYTATGGVTPMIYGASDTSGGSYPFDLAGEMVFQGATYTGLNGGFVWATGQNNSPTPAVVAPVMRLSTAGKLCRGCTATTYDFDTRGESAFGDLGTQTLINPTGNITMAAGAGISLSGSAGTVVSGSSITGSHFGDGSHLTGIINTDFGPSTGSIRNDLTAETSARVAADLLKLSSPTVSGTVGQFASLAADGSVEWRTGSSGGLSFYFFVSTPSDIGGGYTDMVDVSDYTASPKDTKTYSNATDGVIIATRATTSGHPGVTLIPPGIVTYHVHAKKTGAGTVAVRSRTYKRDVGGTETLIATSDVSSALTTSELEYSLTAVISSAIALNITDRIVNKVVAVVTSGTPDVTIYCDGINGDATFAGIQLPAAALDVTNFVPYSGATDDVALGNNNLSTNYGLSGATLTVSGTSQFGSTVRSTFSTTGALQMGNQITMSYAAPVIQMTPTTATNNTYISMTNTGGTAVIGLNNSTGAGLATGGLPYATVIGGPQNATYGAVQLTYGASATPGITLSTAGNTGIGTSLPTDTLSWGRALDLDGATGSGYYARYNGSTTKYISIGQDSTSSYIYNKTSPLAIYVNGASAGAWTSTGLGIGTASPGAALDVVGTVKLGTGGTPLANISTGTYTPTLTNTTNIASSTPGLAKWIRVGNIVTVYGYLEADPTLGADALTQIDISLPVASNFTAQDDGRGMMSPNGAAQWGAGCRANATNDVIDCLYLATTASIGNTGWPYTFMYEVK